jgi:hypothetical protein
MISWYIHYIHVYPNMPWFFYPGIPWAQWLQVSCVLALCPASCPPYVPLWWPDISGLAAQLGMGGEAAKRWANVGVSREKYVDFTDFTGKCRLMSRCRRVCWSSLLAIVDVSCDFVLCPIVGILVPYQPHSKMEYDGVLNTLIWVKGRPVNLVLEMLKVEDLGAYRS